jgi:hypothetical protein
MPRPPHSVAGAWLRMLVVALLLLAAPTAAAANAKGVKTGKDMRCVRTFDESSVGGWGMDGLSCPTERGLLGVDGWPPPPHVGGLGVVYAWGKIVLEGGG